MANKPILIAAAVVLLLSVGSLAVAGAALGSAEEDFGSISADDYLTEAATSHEIQYIDEDGFGSAGFFILIEAEATDENDDGLVDACVDFQFTVMAGSNDVTEESSEVDCTRSATNKFDYEGGEFYDRGFLAVAKICDTYDDGGGTNGDQEVAEDVESCTVGTVYTVESTTSMMVFDSDSYAIEMLGVLGDFLGELLGGSCLGFIGICCGVILLVLGLIVGGNQQTPVIMNGGMAPQAGVGYQAPVGQMPGQPMVQQSYAPPVAQQPTPQAMPQATEQAPASQIWDQVDNQ